ncbi:hypothetical protein, partial [Geoalkalibacter halelectricus]|uniref:hypothetical protein n=1 Tax=Geoalkalibacter halelectricus TaxID=2847045 RepID=UPI003D1B03E4
NNSVCPTKQPGRTGVTLKTTREKGPARQKPEVRTDTSLIQVPEKKTNCPALNHGFKNSSQLYIRKKAL